MLVCQILLHVLLRLLPVLLRLIDYSPFGAMTLGNQQGSSVVDELQEQEEILKQCVGQLESAEATRDSLISQLKEALQDQV